MNANINNKPSLDKQFQKLHQNFINNNSPTVIVNRPFGNSRKSKQIKSKIPTYQDKNKLNKSLAMLYINIRSLNKNFDKLYEMLVNMESKPDIIALSETWITNNRPDEYDIPGFEFLHTKSPTNNGGVAFFISQQYNAQVTNEYNLNTDDCEDLWINVDMKTKGSVVVGVIYRHPNHSFNIFEEKLTATINKLNAKNKKYIFGGDININLLLENDKTMDYTNNHLSIGCNQFINSPTRFSPDLKSKSLLDHIYSNFENDRLETKILAEDISDHLPILVLLTNHNPSIKNLQYNIIQDMRNFNQQQFLEELESKMETFFTNVPTCTPAEELWNHFEEIFQNAVLRHAPFRKRTKREIKLQSKPWMTKAIKKSIMCKNTMFEIALKSSSFPTCLKKYRNILNRVIAQSKRMYYDNQIKRSSGNSKKLWSTINNIISNKSVKMKQIEKLLTEDGKEITNSKEISDEMNLTFVQMAEKLLETSKREKIPKKSSNYISKNKNSFFLNPITVTEMTNLINNLDASKSTRSDTPAIKFIKISKSIIAPYITCIFNKCIAEGRFPSSLKIAEIIPIYKSGHKNISTNYRPISLLSAFSKLFEQYIAAQLTQFFNKNNTLHNLQYGFRQGSSTEMAVSNICEDIAKAVDNKSINCTVFIDLAKAFNTVDPYILLSKLEKYGIRGPPLKLLKSYLTSRLQYTKINNTNSNLMEINIGVPQGSSLGPLLFLVYINDLPLYTKLKVRLFADDACLSYSNDNPKDLEEVINFELRKVHQWLLDNKLFLNYNKSTYLIFTNKKIQHKFNIKIEQNKIEESNSTKYLGVTIDNKLNWKPHILNLKSKLAKNNYLLFKLGNYVNQNTLRTVYYSLIHPFLQYCISTWGSCARSNLGILERLQKQSIRNICHQPRLTHTTPLFLSLSTLKLSDIYKLQVAKLIYNNLQNNIIGENSLVKLADKHNYNTRASAANNFYQHKVNTNVGLRSFSHQGPAIWKDIPKQVKDSVNINQFKTKYKTFLLQTYSDQQIKVV